MMCACRGCDDAVRDHGLCSGHRAEYIRTPCSHYRNMTPKPSRLMAGPWSVYDIALWMYWAGY